MDADVMFEVVRTLLVRSIYPRNTLRQEFTIYIRSALPNLSAISTWKWIE